MLWLNGSDPSQSNANLSHKEGVSRLGYACMLNHESHPPLRSPTSHELLHLSATSTWTHFPIPLTSLLSLAFNASSCHLTACSRSSPPLCCLVGVPHSRCLARIESQILIIILNVLVMNYCMLIICVCVNKTIQTA